MKFCTRVRLKPSNDRGEFELDQARSKNNIAENSIALGHDTHNRCVMVPNREESRRPRSKEISQLWNLID